jgi:Concanavalin A-like lectin/glucanases superfamily
MIALGIVGLLLFILVIVVLYMLTNANKTDEVVILSSSQRGDTTTTYTTPLPRSFNQPEGAVYSYSGWILVNDFTTGYGKQRNVLTKENAPSISLDATSNSLIFGIQTYGSLETILVSNLSAAKWIHFAIVVNQQSVDVYINGTLKQHHTLGQLPKQNDMPITIGSNWNGVIGRVSYWPRELSAREVQSQASQTPPPDLHPSPASPQYFDITWYIGRLNSS